MTFLCTKLVILFISIFMHPDISALEKTDKNASCQSEIDSLTKRLVYINTDILPTNEGGKIALMKQLERAITPNGIVPENYDSNVIVAFIVDKDGSIKGERVVKDKTNNVGQQLLEVVKKLKWTPAKCNNKSVAMLYTLPIIIDIAEQ